MKIRVKTIKEIFGTDKLPGVTPLPRFCSHMVQYCGTEIEITAGTGVWLKGDGWFWNYDWLDLNKAQIKELVKQILKNQAAFITKHDPNYMCDSAMEGYTWANYVLGNYYVPVED